MRVGKSSLINPLYNWILLISYENNLCFQHDMKITKSILNAENHKTNEDGSIHLPTKSTLRNVKFALYNSRDK